MAEFVEVMKEKKRMCGAMGTDCAPCGLSFYNNNCNTGCGEFIRNYPQEAEEIIMKWAKEHPIKTNADKFKEVFGFTPSQKSCPYPISNCEEHCVGGDNGCSHYNFWQQEYVEPKE